MQSLRVISVNADPEFISAANFGLCGKMVLLCGFQKPGKCFFLIYRSSVAQYIHITELGLGVEDILAGGLGAPEESGVKIA